MVVLTVHEAELGRVDALRPGAVAPLQGRAQLAHEGAQFLLHRRRHGCIGRGSGPSGEVVSETVL
jgi:hypothetical protein